MNTFAEKNPRVSVYHMYTKQPVNTDIRVICAHGLMFLVGGSNNGKALVQMFSSNEEPMRCPMYEIEE